MNLRDFKVLSFDCYGTLIDWESGMIAALRPLTDQLAKKYSREDILQAHARHEAAQQQLTPHMPYRNILAVTYKRLAEDWGLTTNWQDCLRYGRSIIDWPAFPDSTEALAYLKEHFKLVILSNIDNESFAASGQKLGVTFDAIFTAEDIGAYKPADKAFQYMLEHLQSRGIAKTDILHVAESLFHDHAPANHHGLASCWIHRHAADGGFGATLRPDAIPHYDFHFESLQAFAQAHSRGNPEPEDKS